MGYAGGTTENPTYRNIGDHSEAVEISFDPEEISYEELLDIFWRSHNPTSRSYSRQYMSLILYHDGEQRIAAKRSLERREKELGQSVFTEIVPLDTFTEAEAYHQKYNLQNNRSLLRELKRYYSDFSDIVDSTAAARINGYLGRYGTPEELMDEIEEFGLSEEGEEELLRIAGPPEPGRISLFFRNILDACGIGTGTN